MKDTVKLIVFAAIVLPALFAIMVIDMITGWGNEIMRELCQEFYIAKYDTRRFMFESAVCIAIGALIALIFYIVATN